MIVSQKPDLVGLQEIGDHAMAVELGRLTGMQSVFGQSLGKKNGYGDVILSRHPFAWVGNEAIPSASTSRYQAMAVDVDLSKVFGEGTAIRFINTHFDWLETMGSQEARLAAVNVIESAFFQESSWPAILTGDLNAIPGSAPLRKLIAKGWVRESLGKDLWTSGAAKPSQQIDYVLFRNKQAWKVLAGEVLDEPVASDHLPIVMMLALKAINLTGTSPRKSR
ncbi:MAG: endonuclease/exonuclease/phosphatase family metal-dependent hydrolase [Akkermansiaceae bacterium]